MLSPLRVYKKAMGTKLPKAEVHRYDALPVARTDARTPRESLSRSF
jgi:hypothetical protein